MTPVRKVKRWAVRWSSTNQRDGTTTYFLWDGTVPLLFRTKAECQEYIKDHWGYIRKRRDLFKEPHGWRMPKAVRVVVTITEAA